MAKKAKKAEKAKAKKAKAKKSAVKKTAAKKTAARKARKTVAPRARGLMPRREDVPGIAPDLPDFANFREAATVLKVAPFFTGPGAVPFSRLRATQILGPGGRQFNDFFLAH